MKIIITYGTYDLLHKGHVSLLRRARELGDRLIVGLSTDRFNTTEKGKAIVQSYEERREILLAIRYVDEVFPEDNWVQKEGDICRTKANVFVMGSDWEGRFDHLASLCEVVYLPRTEGVSTTERKLFIASHFTTEDLRGKADG